MNIWIINFKNTIMKIITILAAILCAIMVVYCFAIMFFVESFLIYGVVGLIYLYFLIVNIKTIKRIIAVERRLKESLSLSEVLKSMIPVALGVTAGMIIYSKIEACINRKIVKLQKEVNALKKQLQQANNRESRTLKSKIVHLKRKIRKLTIKIK